MFDQVLAEMAVTKYRTFWPRFCAGFVDAVVLAPLSLAAIWLGSRIAGGVLVVLYVAAKLVPMAYSVLLHGFYGQTVGKRLLRVKVLDVSESPLTMRQAFLRDLPWIALSTAGMIWGLRAILNGGNPLALGQQAPEPAILQYTGGIWFLAEVVTMLTNKKRRALHDWIAGSVVVRV